MKAVLTAKPASSYDDLIEIRYHFPRTYLRQIERAVGDWIIYYEPRRPTPALNRSGGRQAYFAVARVDRIERDVRRDDHFYAYMRDYLEFDRVVPFIGSGGYYEAGLQKNDGSTNKGAFGRSVRNISDIEFEAILKAGFEIALVGEDRFYSRGQEYTGQGVPQISAAPHEGTLGSFEEGGQEEYGRPTIERLSRRPFRDEAFRHSVRSAYGLTCAMTGLKILNGGGRPEVQAAHIQGVAAGGPDSIRNGIALSGTVHWMFDRGLISVDDDYKILVADDHLPPSVIGLLNPSGRLTLPGRRELRPHHRFLDYHRRNVYKG